MLSITRIRSLPRTKPRSCPGSIARSIGSQPITSSRLKKCMRRTTADGEKRLCVASGHGAQDRRGGRESPAACRRSVVQLCGLPGARGRSGNDAVGWGAGGSGASDAQSILRYDRSGHAATPAERKPPRLRWIVTVTLRATIVFGNAPRVATSRVRGMRRRDRVPCAARRTARLRRDVLGMWRTSLPGPYWHVPGVRRPCVSRLHGRLQRAAEHASVAAICLQMRWYRTMARTN